MVVIADLLYDDALAEAVARRVDEAWRRGSYVVVGGVNKPRHPNPNRNPDPSPNVDAHAKDTKP